MTNSVYAVTMDCRDAQVVADFWATVLGREVAADPSPTHAVVPAGDSGGPTLVFNAVPESKVVKNRVHVDVFSDSFDAEAARLETLGATRLADHESARFRWTTFADVEGNEFDLLSERLPDS